jgi:hypothetical protein
MAGVVLSLFFLSPYSLHLLYKLLYLTTMKTPPLFKDIYAFNVLILNTTKGFPRDYKFSLGEELAKRNLSVLSSIQILISDAAEDKLHQIGFMINHLNMIRLLIRLSLDTKCINVNKFSYINEKTEGILKQLHAWQKAQKKKNEHTEKTRS